MGRARDGAAVDVDRERDPVLGGRPGRTGDPHEHGAGIALRGDACRGVDPGQHHGLRVRPGGQPVGDRLRHGVRHEVAAVPAIGPLPGLRIDRRRVPPAFQLERLDHALRRQRRSLAVGAAARRGSRRRALEPPVACRHVVRGFRLLRLPLQLVDRRRLGVDHVLRVRGVRLQLRGKTVVVRPERPRLALHLPELRLDPAEPRLGAQRPDPLGRVRRHDPGLDAALRRARPAAARAEPGGQPGQQGRRDHGEQQQLAPPHGAGVAVVPDRTRRGTDPAPGRSSRLSRSGGLDNRHREPSTGGTRVRTRQPERRKAARR